MIRALEEHVATWVEQQISGLAAECGLYGRTVASAGVGPTAGGTADQVTVQVWVTGLTPAHEQHGLTSITQGAALHAQAHLFLRIVGTAESLPAAEGRQFSPPTAHTSQVDLVALTLLALLREQTAPAPDGATSPPGPGGMAAAREGTRRVEFLWGTFTVGEPVITTAGGQCQWDVPLTAACTFRLSPAPMAGGRILGIQTRSSVDPGASS